MQIAYFLADLNDTQISLDLLKEIGLGYAFEKSPVIRSVENGKGPEGRSGCVVGRSPKIGYYANRQTWKPHPDVDNVWVGIDTKEPPTPAEMARESWLRDEDSETQPLVIPCHLLESNGRVWPVPIARAWSLSNDQILWSGSLPRSLEYAGDNKFQPGEVQLQFERLEKIAETIQTHYDQSEVPDNFFGLCAEVLGQAYFIGPQEMAMMRLLNDYSADAAAELLFLVIDQPGLIEQLQKKTAADQSAGSSGSED